MMAECQAIAERLDDPAFLARSTYLSGFVQLHGPDPITGYSLVSWDEWFAALDKQKLALKVNDEVPGALDKSHEFVAR